MNNFVFRIKSKLYREIGNIFQYRPTSYPYISGDGFRSMADHLYDETKKCSAIDIKENQIVFIKTEFAKEWFEKIHPDIKFRYKIITHNSDAVIGENEAKYIDDKIIKWFAQNNIYQHEKIIPVPIGIENKKWFMGGWILEKNAKELIAYGLNRKNKILYGFNIKTNIKERTEALKALSKCSEAEEIKGRLNPIQYFKLLNQYNFVASPEGNGPDCIRTWEAMILGIIPIIKNASNNQVLTQNSLPVILIDKWENIGEVINNYDLNVKSDITMFNYWKNIIKNNE